MTRQSLTRCLGLCVIFGALCAGCIIIPTDYHTSDSRTNVREETTTTIIPAQTTKQDVFLALGEPDEASPDGSRLVYRWIKVKAIVLVDHSGGPLKKWYFLTITFDERGVVLHREVHSWGGSFFYSEKYTRHPGDP